MKLILHHMPLQARKLNQEKIFESLPDAILITDLNGVIIECNKVTLDIFHFSDKKDLMGMNCYDIITPMCKQRVNKNIEEKLENKNKENNEYTLLTNSGHEIHVEIFSNVIRDTNAKSKSNIIIIRDITDRKKTEKALLDSEKKYRKLNKDLEARVVERTAELESFAYSVSHDLRAPLRHINGFSRIFMKEYGNQLSKKAKYYLTQIQNRTKSYDKTSR